MSTVYDYYQNVMYAIERIREGYSKTAACAQARISVSAFNAYVKKDETLAGMLEAAEQEGYDALADALLDPANHVLYGESDAKMAKVRSDNIKWVLARRDRKRFGDKVEIENTQRIDVTIVSRLEAARNRLPTVVENVEEAEYEELPPPAHADISDLL